MFVCGRGEGSALDYVDDQHTNVVVQGVQQRLVCSNASLMTTRLSGVECTIYPVVRFVTTRWRQRSNSNGVFQWFSINALKVFLWFCPCLLNVICNVSTDEDIFCKSFVWWCDKAVRGV